MEDDSADQPPASFEQWYRSRHGPIVAALTVMAGDVDLAGEVAAEAFVRALERWERVRAMDSPEGWVIRVGSNLVRRQLRRSALERRLLRHVPRDQAPTSIGVELWDAVRGLPLRQRQALALRYLLGMSQSEVAEAMGVAPGTAAATLAAARRRLATALGDDAPAREVTNG